MAQAMRGMACVDFLKSNVGAETAVLLSPGLVAPAWSSDTSQEPSKKANLRFVSSLRP